MIAWWRTDIAPEAGRRMKRAIEDRCISQGPLTMELEKNIGDFLGVPHVVMTTSGSMALLLALLARGIGPGDEVIVPNRTFVATANAALLLGAKVRLVDVEPDRPLMEPEALSAVINVRTKAILPVHLNGRAADMERIKAVADQHGLALIEDAAQALGSRHRQGAFLGAMGDLGAFSLGLTKLITTGQGGFAATHDRQTYERLLAIRNQGRNGEDENPRGFGFNFKFNDLLAAMGLAQMMKIQDRIDRHRSVYREYTEALADLPFIRMLAVDLDAGEVPLWVETLCDNREQVMAECKRAGIETRAFGPGLNTLPHLRDDRDFPNSRVYAEKGLILPCGPDQPDEAIEQVIAVLKRIGANHGRKTGKHRL